MPNKDTTPNKTAQQTAPTQKQAPQISDDEMKMPEDTFGGGDTTSESRSVVPVILMIIIVLLVLTLAGLYLWGEVMKNEAPDTTPVEIDEINTVDDENAAETDTTEMEAVSTSDELDAIEADLENTDLDSLDAEMDDIDAEMEAEASAQ